MSRERVVGNVGVRKERGKYAREGRRRRREGDEEVERRRGRKRTRDGCREPEGEIMQKEIRRRDEMKGETRGWSARVV